MVKHATGPAHTITDKDGDRFTTVRFQDGLYVTVTQAELARPRTVGPFTPEELHAAIAQAAGYTPMPGDLVAASELEKAEEARDKAQALLAVVERESEARRKALAKMQGVAVDLENRNMELLDRARAAEQDRDAAQQAVTELTQGGEATAEELAAQQPRPRTPESVTDREVEAVLRGMGYWQEGKRATQHPVTLYAGARRSVVALANLPLQEQAEVDAIAEWLGGIGGMGVMARELYARGFTAPGGES